MTNLGHTKLNYNEITLYSVISNDSVIKWLTLHFWWNEAVYAFFVFKPSMTEEWNMLTAPLWPVSVQALSAEPKTILFIFMLELANTCIARLWSWRALIHQRKRVSAELDTQHLARSGSQPTTRCSSRCARLAVNVHWTLRLTSRANAQSCCAIKSGWGGSCFNLNESKITGKRAAEVEIWKQTTMVWLARTRSATLRTLLFGSTQCSWSRIN